MLITGFFLFVGGAACVGATWFLVSDSDEIFVYNAAALAGALAVRSRV